MWRMAILAVAIALGACAEDTNAPEAGAGLDASMSVARDLAMTIDDGVPPSIDASVTSDFTASVDLSSSCPAAPTLHASCDPKVPSSCPGGACLVNLCVGERVDPHRFDSCGDGTCGACESAQSCPADCAPAPVISGSKGYDDPKTITIWLHGFTNHTAASLKNTVYGAVTGPGDLAGATKAFGVPTPDGSDPNFDTAPNQLVGVEYYGAVPPAWMSQQDIAEVEQYPYLGGATGLQRYSLIVAKFIRWRMAHTGATHVNIACHSMGCLLARFVIENDLEHLASQSVIARWVTSAGVVAGAQLALLYGNPKVQMTADQIGLAVDDFAAMNPANVQLYAASYDHKLYEGNNPLFGGILIHHVGATDPRVAAAANLQLLNLDNPMQQPNDGIMFTFDEMFASQSAAASVKTPSGEIVSATHSFIHVQHQDSPAGGDFQTQLVAALFHRRKVFVTLDSINLKKDHELSLSTPLEVGLPPAEVVAETRVDYNSYSQGKANLLSLVDDDELAYWSPPMFQQTINTTLTPHQVLYEGPIFDDQTSLHLKLILTETDFYVRYGTQESLGPLTDKQLLSFEGDLPLSEGTIPASGDGASISIKVHVVSLY